MLFSLRYFILTSFSILLTSLILLVSRHQAFTEYAVFDGELEVREKNKSKVQADSGAASPLVSSGTSRRIKLKEQPLIIQDILHRGIAKASEDVILVKTWPEESSRNIYGKHILLKVCDDKELADIYKDGLANVKSFLKHDSKFAKAMSDVVCSALYLQIYIGYPGL